jgi:hypothetical protein
MDFNYEGYAIKVMCREYGDVTYNTILPCIKQKANIQPTNHQRLFPVTSILHHSWH